MFSLFFNPPKKKEKEKKKTHTQKKSHLNAIPTN